VTDTERASLARGFLFADLRGYSAFVERHGDQAGADLIRTYRDLVRAAVAAFRGAEIRTEGDSFYVAFDSPSAAVRCGLAILTAAAQAEGPDGRPIQVGVGVHAGETVETDEGYVGSVVNIAARVCARASAGELLVTDAVRALTATYLRVGFQARGRHRLKGIAEPVALYRVTAVDHGLAGRASWTPLQAMRAHGRLLAGALVLAAVAIGASVLGAVLLREGRGGGEPDPSASVVANASEGNEAASPSASALAPTGEYPTAAEQGLLDRLPSGVPARTCRRATRILRVQVYPVTPSGIMPTVAAVTCDPGSPSSPHVVTYWAANTSVEVGGNVEHNWVEEAFFQMVGARQIPAGECETDQAAYRSWSIGDLDGRFLCSLTDEGDLEIVWTYDDEQIIASAIRRDNDLDVLLGWWQDNRFITPSP
jgi:class 3 adenylate cyclase